MSDTSIAINVIGCQRCGKNHPMMEFFTLDNPVDAWSRWATCPATGQPILMKLVNDSEPPVENRNGYTLYRDQDGDIFMQPDIRRIRVKVVTIGAPSHNDHEKTFVADADTNEKLEFIGGSYQWEMFICKGRVAVRLNLGEVPLEWVRPEPAPESLEMCGSGI